MAFRNDNVLNYLEDTAEAFPDKAAIVDPETSYTFEEFRDMARRIGTKINESTSVLNQPIFVSVDRSAKPLICFFGALYSGNFYVPIDSATPLERLSAMIEAIKPAAYIHFGQDQAIQIISETYASQCHFFTFDDVLKCEAEPARLAKIRASKLDIDPCYILFTSGSTGVPKGVVISHRMVVDLTEWLNSVIRISHEDRIGNQTPFFFDASVKEIYQMLKTGATLYIVPTQLFMFPTQLIDYLNDNRITVILWASSAITIVANSGILTYKQPQHLRLMSFAGEQLHTRHLNLWRQAVPELQLFNLYGPTETSVDCAYYEVTREFADDEVIPIGKACKNKELFMLDKDGRIIEHGSGELCVRGSGVSMGYYGEKALTEEVFIQNPKHNLYRDIIYRTGDLVQLDEDGNYVFLSRIDNQIKRHGHRIELGEIEAALTLIPGIKDSAVVYDEASENLAMFYTGEKQSNQQIIRTIRKTLPKYMIPTHYTFLERMPYTRNGKIDRKSLLDQFINQIGREKT